MYNTYFTKTRGGFFLEIGAFDGSTWSNSLFFEETLGWCVLELDIPAQSRILVSTRYCACTLRPSPVLSTDTSLRGCLSFVRRLSWAPAACTQGFAFTAGCSCLYTGTAAQLMRGLLDVHSG